MTDRIFAAALAFCVLAGGTAAIASAWFEARPVPAANPMPVVHLPQVYVTGKARAERPAEVATREELEPTLRRQQ